MAVDFRFNSTMVRLVAGDACEKLPIVTSFQFHYGTIGSVHKCYMVSPVSSFQFHYGTIGSMLIGTSIEN